MIYDPKRALNQNLESLGQSSNRAQLCNSPKRSKENLSFVAFSFHSMITALIDRVPKMEIMELNIHNFCFIEIFDFEK